jgi:hypothetical protein
VPRGFLSTLKAGLSGWLEPALKPLFSRAVRTVAWNAVRDGADHLLLVGGAAHAENLDLVERVPVR